MHKNSNSLLGVYGFTGFLTIAIIVLAVAISGPVSLLPLLILAIIEITFGFDNAVINSQILSTMSRRWQIVFLTLGIAIAVFGARLVLPLIMVSAASGNSIGAVFDFALNNPEQYSAELSKAYPLIAAFGGVFLLMIGLRFFGERKNVYWLDTLESPLGEFNQPWSVVLGGAALAIGSIYFILAPGNNSVGLAALLGATTFFAIKGVSEFLIKKSQKRRRGNQLVYGKAAFLQFIYLELIDASFSMDSVIAAFAITKDVLLIAVGLTIGALYVRSITIHFLRRGTLIRYRYLVHGAHYAIGGLSIILILSVRFHIPEPLTGMLSLSFIGAALYNSIVYNKRMRRFKLRY